MKHKFLFLSILLILEGCVSLSKSQCLTGDWENVGYKDGIKGKASETLGSHIDACTKHGVKIDRQLYDKGFKDGLKKYCVPQKGYSEGAANNKYYNVCNGKAAQFFERGYELGKQEYYLSYNVNLLTSDISSLENNISEAEGKIDRLESKLGRAQSHRKKGELRDKIAQKRAQRRLNRESLLKLERSLVRAEYEEEDKMTHIEAKYQNLLQRWRENNY